MIVKVLHIMMMWACTHTVEALKRSEILTDCLIDKNHTYRPLARIATITNLEEVTQVGVSELTQVLDTRAEAPPLAILKDLLEWLLDSRVADWLALAVPLIGNREARVILRRDMAEIQQQIDNQDLAVTRPPTATTLAPPTSPTRDPRVPLLRPTPTLTTALASLHLLPATRPHTTTTTTLPSAAASTIILAPTVTAATRTNPTPCTAATQVATPTTDQDPKGQVRTSSENSDRGPQVAEDLLLFPILPNSVVSGSHPRH